MKFDGRDYRPNRSLGWRNAQEGDVYAADGFVHKKGEQIASNYVVIFRTKDADTIERDGRLYYKPESVPSDKILPLIGHSLTSLAIGPVKLRTAGRKDVYLNIGEGAGRILLDGEKYVEQAHYLVRDGHVYQWTSRRLANREDMAA